MWPLLYRATAGCNFLVMLFMQTSSCRILYSMVRRAARRLSWNEGHLSSSIIFDTLEVLRQRLKTKRASLRWIASMLSIFACVRGSHTVAAYSMMSRTRVLYAVSLISRELIFRFSLRKTRILLAFEQTLLMCSF